MEKKPRVGYYFFFLFLNSSRFGFGIEGKRMEFYYEIFIIILILNYIRYKSNNQEILIKNIFSWFKINFYLHSLFINILTVGGFILNKKSNCMRPPLIWGPTK